MNSEFTYSEPTPAQRGKGIVRIVKLGRKRVGLIRQGAGGFAYCPTGSITSGDLFPTLPQCQNSLEREDDTPVPEVARPELSYDGCGINGPDEYGTRIATFSKMRSEESRHYGPLFAASPDLLAALDAIRARINGEFDNANLMAFGPLSTVSDDCRAIAEGAIARLRAK